jgi:hypothetical protein
MRKILCFFVVLVFLQQNMFAQQKNFVKVNVGDCINCNITLSQILKKDPQLTFVIHGAYIADSTDVIEKFNLEAYRKQIIWSSKLYDSLSKAFSSEFIQYCGNKEVNRSGLKNVTFLDQSNCESNSICLKGISNNITFYDYKNYLLITNHISKQQIVYFKETNRAKVVKIDSSLVRSIYVDFLKSTKEYEHYMYMTTVAALFKPRITSLCAFNDSTVLGCLVTYKCDSITTKDSFYSKVLSIIKVSNSTSKIEFVKNELPIPFHSLNENNILSHNQEVYFTLLGDMNNLSKNNMPIQNLVRYKKRNQAYQFNKAMPTRLNDYLITNNVYNQCNMTFVDNGFSLMSLSDYIINLETEEKINLPFADTLFKNIYLYPEMKGINYYVWDFKYNKQEDKFYLLYFHYGKTYIASFKRGDTKWSSNEFVYSYSEFIQDVKNVCLSWDGKRILYCMNNENCFKYASLSEIQEMAKTYHRAVHN